VRLNGGKTQLLDRIYTVRKKCLPPENYNESSEYTAIKERRIKKKRNTFHIPHPLSCVDRRYVINILPLVSVSLVVHGVSLILKKDFVYLFLLLVALGRGSELQLVCKPGETVLETIAGLCIGALHELWS